MTSEGASMPDLDITFQEPMIADQYEGQPWHLSLDDYEVQYREGQTYLYDEFWACQGGSAGSAGQWFGPGHQLTAIPMHFTETHKNLKRDLEADGSTQSHECAECRCVFSNLQSLDEHAKAVTHKAWRCLEEGCGKTYARRDGFTRHQHKHKDGGHACDICKQEGKRKVFKRKDHLTEHIKKCHPQSLDDPSRSSHQSQAHAGKAPRKQLSRAAALGTHHQEPQKHQAMQTIIKSLGTVLGEDHRNLQGLEHKMITLSESKVESVAETIAASIVEVAAKPEKKCGCHCS